MLWGKMQAVLEQSLTRGCAPKGGPLRHLFPVAYAKITAPSVKPNAFSASNLVQCRKELTQHEPKRPRLMSAADIQLISDHRCDCCDGECQGLINSVLTIN